MEDNRITKSNTVRQVKLAVSVPRKAAAGETFDLLITLTNEGTAKVVFGRINGYRDCKIRVFDSKRQVCPFTPFGKQVMGGERNSFKKYIATPLANGESHTWQIDLTRCFELKPSKYTVSVSIELNLSTYPFEVAVQDVEFEVEGARTAEPEL